jgi:hypothetical protein
MRLLYLLFILLFTSCGVGFQYTTLNHAGHIDGIYSSNDYKIDTLNEFQVRNKLRTDFNFRYDIAQYALSQPASFDWNNRLLGNRYNWNRPYWGYSYYWNRTQMWNDWAWGYPYSNWGYNNWHSWNRPYWGWNNSWWNNWGWRQQMNDYAWIYRNRSNTVRINGYRTFNRTSTRTVVNNTNRRTTPSVNVNNNNRTIKVNKPRVNYNSKPRINTPRVRVNTPPRQPSTIRTTPRISTRSTNNTTVRSNSRRKN